MRLGDISQIESGLILSRKRARNELELVEVYKVLSLTNIEVQGDFNEAELERFPSNDQLDDRYFTQEGDILLRLNDPFTAVYIDKHQAGVLIPSYFVTIKIITDEFLPEYVSWFLNTTAVKEKFIQAQSGTRTPTINQKIIRELDIPKLPIEKQNYITGLHRLYLKERRLLNQLIHEKDRYFQAISNKIIQEKLEEYE